MAIILIEATPEQVGTEVTPFSVENGWPAEREARTQYTQLAIFFGERLQMPLKALATMQPRDAAHVCRDDGPFPFSNIYGLVGARARQTSYPLYFETDATVEALALAYQAGKIKGFRMRVGDKTLTHQDWAHVVQDLMNKLAAANAAEAKLKEQIKDLEAEKAQLQASLVASQKDHFSEVHDLQAEMQKLKRVNRALLSEIQGDQPLDEQDFEDDEI